MADAGRLARGSAPHSSTPTGSAGVYISGKYWGLVGLLLLLLSACGHSAATPTAPTTASVQYVDGETGLPVAVVTQQVGDVVAVTASGFLQRTTRSIDRVQTLWPVRYGGTPEDIHSLAFSPEFNQHRIAHPPLGHISLVAGAGFEERDLTGPAQEATAATGGLLQIDTALGGLRVEVVGDGKNLTPLGNAGYTDRWFNRSTGLLDGATIHIAAKYKSSGALLHELGHVMGLGHSTRSADRMNPSLSQGAKHFSALEKLTLKMLLSRQPGTLWEDNDA